MLPSYVFQTRFDLQLSTTKINDFNPFFNASFHVMLSRKIISLLFKIGLRETCMSSIYIAFCLGLPYRTPTIASKLMHLVFVIHLPEIQIIIYFKQKNENSCYLQLFIIVTSNQGRIHYLQCWI